MAHASRKLILILSSAALLLVSASAFALQVIPRNPPPTLSPTQPSNDKPKTQVAEAQVAPPAEKSTPPTTPTAQTLTLPVSKTATPTTAPPIISSPPPPIPLRFTAGTISTAYTSCSFGTLQYTIGGVDISINQLTSQSFTWKIELSDGTVSESGTDVMPSGSYMWFGFPSTPTYPSMLGTIVGANDGDMARFVITSPNYSAGNWSTPVPLGSEEACRNGQM